MSGEDVWIEVRALAQVLDTLSYYDVLGVERDAPLDQVRAAFVKRSRVFHPDRQRGGAPEDRRRLVSLQARINEAYQVLSDERRRAAYDRGLEGGTLRLAGGRAAAPVGPGTAAGDPGAPDLSVPAAQRFFALGAESERSGDDKAAVLHYQMALQLEPGSRALREALSRLGQPVAEAPVEPAARPAAGASAEPAARPAGASAEPAAAPAGERRHERHPYPRPVKLRLSSWRQFETLHARDISSGGMFVRTTATFAVGARLDLKLVLPDQREVSLGAEVVHVIPAERRAAGAIPGIGVRFLPMEPAARAALEEVVAHARAQGPTLRAEDLFSDV